MAMGAVGAFHYQISEDLQRGAHKIARLANVHAVEPGRLF